MIIFSLQMCSLELKQALLAPAFGGITKQKYQPIKINDKTFGFRDDWKCQETVGPGMQCGNFPAANVYLPVKQSALQLCQRCLVRYNPRHVNPMGGW